MAGFFKNLFNKVTNRAEIDWDELEADLISADLGPRLTVTIVDELRGLGRAITAQDVVTTTRAHIAKVFPEDQAFPPALQESGKPTVLLIVGVNGTGKTTSVAKLGHLLNVYGHSVRVAAADTFRAAAVEQLQSWAARLDLPITVGRHQADPASVCYTAHREAIAEGADFLLCDTAGRLHTRHNLMEELGKIRRIIAKQDETAPHKTILVVDATTGSNALAQAKEFNKAVPLDGLIVTKLDGSGKGGIAVSIQQELGIAPLFIGTGEEPNKFQPFEREKFVSDIL
ncbi:signal recognition particle-docking protein FtsY [Roseibacillus ishigakijimensis]|uniref:Signal recognition particle-docking protein FtsY n=1 Tax=Roseibacillus ishigakijimensis TaxID=454146 RepID=A0A934RNA1_9BACT|nr:signal recognition particle-docking protein FtsY [Roseibacillus ishigakijimensis]MBK1834937.1 signal recognition particle-docking protein FtsY [Roseibacillus ishigakijimensis]